MRSCDQIKGKCVLKCNYLYILLLKLKSEGKLADLAPTILDLMNIDKPEEMTGETLLEKE